ncbi:D-glycerate dehydrogenase [Paenibacillus athensensis]|uniref:Bifunctional glyoxylate/hydroxypyruvate reductase B n=1 Tax=Paenibacillus athensensis TaxID=1967502 RepID=A0A4Y8PX24_9BACL|nr:D-glycerate dehydrogenase [Paenibacillus athensensis]MCD1260603.1 D-glycerate dehydrogenase [Paenibacillus athensensis]
MKPRIFVTRPVPAEVESYLQEHCECDFWGQEEPVPRQMLLERTADVQGLLTAGGKIDAELFDHAKQLRVVSSLSVGYNHYDLPAMKQRGIIGTHTPYVLDESVADLVLALMLGTARRVVELDRYVREGRWQRGDNEVLYGFDVHHATVGIIGLGRIGEAIARRARFGFAMNVLYHNRSRKPQAEEELGAAYRTLDELLAESDYVVLMTPLTPETKQLIGRRELALMKPSAIFINVSRGQNVDEAALLEALQTGAIRAAGLDVFDREPIGAEHPLLQLPNVIALPHIGSATAKTRFDMAMLAAQNLVAGLEGRTPPNVVQELQ